MNQGKTQPVSQVECLTQHELNNVNYNNNVLLFTNKFHFCSA